MDIEPVKAFLLTVWNFTGVKVIVFGVLLNLVLALAVAIKDGKFNIPELSEFIFKQMVPYVIVYAIFALIGDAAGYPGVADAVLGIIVVTIGAKIVANLKALGITLPETVQKLVAKPGA